MDLHDPGPDANDASGLFCLLYVSEMARPDAPEVRRICEQSRANNSRDRITGLLVFDANLPIIDHLKAMTRGEADTGSVTLGTVLLRRESFEHSYPHC